MRESLFIGIDIGTGGTKTVLCDKLGNTVADAFCPSHLLYPEPNAVTEDPEIIFNSVITTIKEVMDKSGAEPCTVHAIGIDGQMAGIMAVDKDFNAATPLDSWLDSRCNKYTELIKQELGEGCIAKSGGQISNTHAAKILWWKNEHPDVYEKIAKFVMPSGYVVGRLCGLKSDDAFMDYTYLHFNNFSDNLKKAWNDEALAHFGISRDKLPKINAPYDIVGKVLPEFAALCGITEDTAVISGCGDTAASSLGAGITKAGLAYDVAGTASVFACCTDRFKPDTEHGTLLFSRSAIEGLYLPLAYVTGGGIRLKWFADLVRSDLKTLDKKAEECEIGSGGVVFVPHFSGRSYPLNNDMRGSFQNLGETVGEAELYRSILEAIAFEYKGYLNVMREVGCVGKLSAVRGVGGGAKSPVFAKIKADVLGVDYVAAENICSAPEAMAKLAAYSVGELSGSLAEIFANDAGNVIKFNADSHEKYTTPYDRYYGILNK